MPTQTFTNAYVSLNGNNVSNMVRSVTMNAEVAMEDDTTMGDNTRSNKPGLRNWTAELTFAQDVAASAIDSIINPLVGTTFPVEFRANNTTVSTNNPKWTGSATISSYRPLGGNVGALLESTVSLVPSKTTTPGSADLVRATS